MKKLFDNDRGSLKNTFEDLESIPSFELWKGMESRLHALNREKRNKRRRRGFITLLSTCVAFLIWLSISPPERLYYPNYPSGQLAVSDDNTPDFPGFTARKSAQSKVSHPSAALQGAGREEPIDFADNGNDVDIRLTDAEIPQTAPLSRGIQHMDIVSVGTELHALEMHPLLSVSPVDDYKAALKKQTNKPQLFVRGGLDAARGEGLYAPVKTFQNNSLSSALSSKGPYDYKLPLSFSAGILKPFGPCFSIFGGLTYTLFAGEAETRPRKGSYASIQSRSVQYGLMAGARLNIVDSYALKPFVSGGLNLCFAPGVRSRITDYDNGLVVADRVTFTPTQNLFVAAIGSVGMSYILTDRLSIELEVQSLKPIKNYRNEMNLYGGEEKYHLGSRLGIFVSL